MRWRGKWLWFLIVVRRMETHYKFIHLIKFLLQWDLGRSNRHFDPPFINPYLHSIRSYTRSSSRIRLQWVLVFATRASRANGTHRLARNSLNTSKTICFFFSPIFTTWSHLIIKNIAVNTIINVTFKKKNHAEHRVISWLILSTVV